MDPGLAKTHRLVLESLPNICKQFHRPGQDLQSAILRPIRQDIEQPLYGDEVGFERGLIGMWPWSAVIIDLIFRKGHC